MYRLLILFGILLLTPFAQPQDKVLSEDNLISTLFGSKPDEKAAALRSIGVPDEVAQGYKGLNASLSNEISWHRLRSSGSEKEAALFLPCLDGSHAAYLFLVGHTSVGWKVQDTYTADCHYKGNVSVELAANIVPGFDTILLHMDCDSHGSGYVEHHFHVLNPVQGKLREILHAEESVFWSGWGEEPGSLRRSVFIPIPSANGTRIEQTQITQRLDKQTDQPSPAGEDVSRRRSTACCRPPIRSSIPQSKSRLHNRLKQSIASIKNLISCNKNLYVVSHTAHRTARRRCYSCGMWNCRP